MLLFKGSMIRQLLSVISICCLTASISGEFSAEINQLKALLTGCSNLCSNSKELRCQCLQIPKEIVENCNQTYFKTGISKLDRHGEAILLKRRLKAMTKINRIEISKEEYSKLGPKCIPEVSPLMFLDELGRLFEGLSTLQQKK